VVFELVRPDLNELVGSRAGRRGREGAGGGEGEEPGHQFPAFVFHGTRRSEGHHRQDRSMRNVVHV
jgi:hypothetical protein